MNRIPKAVYTKEFRDEAVKLAMTDGRQACPKRRGRLSISMKTLANWVRAAKDGKAGEGRANSETTDRDRRRSWGRV